MQESDFAYIAADPDSNDGRDYRLVLVVAVASNDDGETVDVVTFPDLVSLTGLPVFATRDELEAELRKHFAAITGAQGIANPLKAEDGTRRQPTIADVLPWHNGVYPLASGAAAAALAATPYPGLAGTQFDPAHQDA